MMYTLLLLLLPYLKKHVEIMTNDASEQSCNTSDCSKIILYSQKPPNES